MKYIRFAPFLLLTAAVAGQTISSSVSGVVVDPTGAAIVKASCKLTNQSTGAVLAVESGGEGFFRFQSVLAGMYLLTVESPGFKTLGLRDVAVTSSENRTLGRLAMELGEVRDSVSVTVERATLVELASAERSGVVTGSQLADIALKGRDFFALLATIPGVVDTNQSREATAIGANMSIFINGSRDNAKDFSVDGMVDHDSHGNQSMSFVPNMDAIAEVKILTSNYQAEYGRNSGGTITVISKSGSREFHGSGFDYYRHESLNANSFFNNRTGTLKLPYRYRISGYSIGGPVYLPGQLNKNKEKLFFFWSQEYTGVKRDFGAQFVNVPTERERNGDFSASYDVNRALIPVRDPQTSQPFPGNVVPKSRLNALGQSILNFYPLPNYTDPDPRNLYRWNYRSVYSGGLPRRTDLLRIDANVNPSLRVFYRYAHDRGNSYQPWGYWGAGSVNYLLSPIFSDRYGTGHLVQVTKTFSPTLVNETSFGATRVSRDFDLADPSVAARSKMGNPPQWYKDPSAPRDYIPNVSFGGQPASPINASLTNQLPNRYRNPVYSVTDNFSKVFGWHSVKAGLYVERTYVEGPYGGNIRGAFSFSRDVNNPFDSGHSFANALLGNFTSYSEATKFAYVHELFWNTEWYLQDNWRVTKRLTLDIGLRFYHMPPIIDLEKQLTTMDPALYNRQKAPALYVPAFDAQGRRVAKDPTTGALAIAPLIGQYVPGTGDPVNGMAVGGVDGYVAGVYTRPWLNLGPRFGIAYDLLGNGKTALRAGWGWFFDTGQNNPVSDSAGNPPVAYTPVLSYGNLDTYAQSQGAIGPSSMSIMFGHHKVPNTMNYSAGIQHQIRGTVIDAAYVGSLARNLFLRRNMNPIPMFAHFDPKNADPTQPGRPLPDNFLRPYFGHGNLNVYEQIGTSNYHSLQVSVNRRLRRGLQFGLAYTFSKVLGVAESDTATISSYFPPRQYNYGPFSYDRSQNLVVNYMYDLPKLGQKTGWKAAEWVLDNWQIGGITSFISGAPFTPGFSTVDGADITGSTDGARVTVIGDPRLPKGERDFYRNFRTEVFKRTPVGSFGNAGLGILRGPGINNWDFNVSKRVPLFSEGRYIQFRTEMFNAWNHTQFSGLYTSARFDVNGNQTDPNFGAYSSARTPRIIQLSLRVVF